MVYVFQNKTLNLSFSKTLILLQLISISLRHTQYVPVNSLIQRPMDVSHHQTLMEEKLEWLDFSLSMMDYTKQLILSSF